MMRENKLYIDLGEDISNGRNNKQQGLVLKYTYMYIKISWSTDLNDDF